MLNISTHNRSSKWGGFERFPGAAPSTYDNTERLQYTQSIMGKQKNEQKGRMLEKIFRGSDHLPIIIEDERVVPIKQQHRWSIGRTNWMQFQGESRITTNLQDQNTTKETYICLNETILQTAEINHLQNIFRDKEKTISSMVEQRMWKEERAECRKHRQASINRIKLR